MNNIDNLLKTYIIQKFEKIIKHEMEMLELEKLKGKDMQNVIGDLNKSYEIVKTNYKTAQKSRDQLFENASIHDVNYKGDYTNFMLNIFTSAEAADLKRIEQYEKKIIYDNEYTIPEISTDMDEIHRMINIAKENYKTNLNLSKVRTNEITELEAKINHFKQEEIELDSALAAAQQSIESFEKSKNDEIDVIEKEIDNIEYEIAQVNERIEKLKQPADDKESETKKIFSLTKISLE